MASVLTRNFVQKALSSQKMRPFCTAIDFLGECGLFSNDKTIRFCFLNDEYPYWIELRQLVFLTEICIRNAYNGDNLIAVPYTGDNADAADSLYAKMFEKKMENNVELKRLIYKVMIGDLPLNQMLIGI